MSRRGTCPSCANRALQGRLPQQNGHREIDRATYCGGPPREAPPSRGARPDRRAGATQVLVRRPVRPTVRRVEPRYGRGHAFVGRGAELGTARSGSSATARRLRRDRDLERARHPLTHDAAVAATHPKAAHRDDVLVFSSLGPPSDARLRAEPSRDRDVEFGAASICHRTPRDSGREDLSHQAFRRSAVLQSSRTHARHDMQCRRRDARLPHAAQGAPRYRSAVPLGDRSRSGRQPWASRAGSAPTDSRAWPATT